MRISRPALTGVVLSAVAFPALGAVLVPVPAVQNSTTTTAFAINDNDVIAGSYIGSDGVEHSFFGPLGSYTSFDAGSGGSEARGINDKGEIAGFSNSQNGVTSNEPAFERKTDGTIVNVTIGGQQLYGQLQAINKSGEFAGTRWDTSGFDAVAFVGRRGKWTADVTISQEHQASTAQGVNNAGVVVGSYFHPPTHGYIVNGSTLTTVDYPSQNSQGTVLEGINEKGLVVGQWYNAAGNARSFIYNPATAIFTDIKVKGASNIAAWAINAKGAIAVSTDIGSYIWCRKAQQCPGGGREVDAPVHAAGGSAHVAGPLHKQ